MGILLGAIADDLTGATDLALMLTRNGMRTVQVMGVPEKGTTFDNVDAVVIALKSRTNPPAEAVAWSCAACDVLRAAGAEQILFKYCSTFDSTEHGNIGPVAEALLEKLDGKIAVVCPAFPTTQRTIFKGHLFVGNQLLSDSPMKNHPLTPMQNANLVEVMQAQTGMKVGLVPYEIVAQGADHIRTAIQNLQVDNVRFAVVDAISDQHLHSIADAISDSVLITGGSGIALGLPNTYAAKNKLTLQAKPESLQARHGRQAILAGSCSAATQAQVAHAIAQGIPAMRLDALELAAGSTTPDDCIAFANQQSADQPVLIYSTQAPDTIKDVQNALGREAAGELVENAMATIATNLVNSGVTQLIVAGGETSGAVVGALEVSALEIGPEIDPGVPWTRSIDDRALTLALKSGNFGAEDFFTKAWTRLTASSS